MFYNLTLGKLVEYDFIEPPKLAPGSDKTMNMGRKGNILFYGFILIAIGVYIIFFSKI